MNSETRDEGERSGAPADALPVDAPRHVFVGVTEVAGYYRNLTSGFRCVGVPATFVDLSGHPFRYEATEGPAWASVLSRTLAAIRGGTGDRRSPRWWAWSIARAAAIPGIFVWALLRCDVFLFGYGRSFLGLWDLPLLRLLGKRVVVSYHGTDLRPPYLDGTFTSDPDRSEASALVRRSSATKRRARRVERWSHDVVVHAPIAQFLERPFVRSVAIGLPIALRSNTTSRSSADRPLRVLHAPSAPLAKGTAEIRRVVSALIDDGFDIELVEITNKPHSVVLQALDTCDLVVDQMFADTPLAGLATEAAAAAVPSLVAGYGLSAIAEDETPPGLRPVSIVCEPDRIEATLRSLVNDREQLAEIGAQARRFVTEEWNPAAVARRYLKVFNGTWPESGRTDPNELRYVAGSGVSRRRSAEVITDIVHQAGTSALQVDDKPQLLADLLHLTEQAGAAPSGFGEPS